MKQRIHNGVRICRNGKWWQLVWTDDDGRRCTRGAGTIKKTQREVKEDIDRLVKAGVIGLPTSRTDTATITKHAEQYLAHRRGLVAKSTVKSEACAIRSLIDHAGDIDLSDVTLETIQQWRQCVSPRQAEATTRKQTKELRRFFSSALEHGLVEANPALSPSMPITDIAPNPFMRRTVTEKELMPTLVCMGDTPWRHALMLGYFLGSRKGELLRIKWSDVNLDTQLVHIWSTKTSSERWTHIDTALAGYLREHQVSGTGLIVDEPSSYNRANKVLAAACSTAGVKPFTWKDLRITRANIWRVEGYSSEYINKWLGHTARVAERHYIAPNMSACMTLTQALSEIERLKSIIQGGNDDGQE